MRDLIRNAEGTIDRADFRRGAGLVLALSAVLGLLVFGASRLSERMDWMTVAVAPIVGGLVLMAAMSIVYFWYCLFVKRLRAMEVGRGLVGGWLAALFIAGGARVAGGQVKALDMAGSGPLAHLGSISVLAAFVAAVLFFILVGIGLLGPDRPVPPGSCSVNPGSKPGSTGKAG